MDPFAGCNHIWEKILSQVLDPHPHLGWRWSQKYSFGIGIFWNVFPGTDFFQTWVNVRLLIWQKKCYDQYAITNHLQNNDSLSVAISILFSSTTVTTSHRITRISPLLLLIFLNEDNIRRPTNLFFHTVYIPIRDTDLLSMCT